MTDSRCPGVQGHSDNGVLKNLSTGIEASATGESLNSGDPAVHPAARHRVSIPWVKSNGFNFRNDVPTMPLPLSVDTICDARRGSHPWLSVWTLQK